MAQVLQVGLVGKRGSSFVAAFRTLPEVEVVAFCDIDPNVREAVASKYGIQHIYDNYAAMVDTDLDIIVVATPMQLHVQQSVMALAAGKHVLCEVPVAVSLDECYQLVETVEKTKRTFMMAENYCYMPENVLVRELVRQGFFGEVYFGQGEYIHELKELNAQTPWRRVWQTGRNGNTYPTHSLGPVLQWMDDHVASVCCLGSGHHYHDSRGRRYENEDTTLTLCKLRKGGLVQLRLDMLSNRPHNMAYYALQGTKGCYEAARVPGESSRLWLADFCSDPQEWRPLTDFNGYLPQAWQNPPAEACLAGHGGGDFWEVWDFVQAIRTGTQPPVDVRTAAHWTAVGLCTEMSVARAGAPVDVPGFDAAVVG